MQFPTPFSFSLPARRRRRRVAKVVVAESDCKPGQNADQLVCSAYSGQRKKSEWTQQAGVGERGRSQSLPVPLTARGVKERERGGRAFVALTIWLKFNKLYEMLPRVGNAVGPRRRQLGANDFNFSDNDVDMAMDEVRASRWAGKTD